MACAGLHVGARGDTLTLQAGFEFEARRESATRGGHYGEREDPLKAGKGRV